jgi:hypothetical protein
MTLIMLSQVRLGAFSLNGYCEEGQKLFRYIILGRKKMTFLLMPKVQHHSNLALLGRLLHRHVAILENASTLWVLK